VLELLQLFDVELLLDQHQYVQLRLSRTIAPPAPGTTRTTASATEVSRQP